MVPSRAVFLGEKANEYGNNESVVPYATKGEVILVFQQGFLDEKGNLVKDPGVPPEILTLKSLYEKIYGRSPSGIA